MFTTILILIVLPAITSVIATSTNVIPLYDDEGEDVIDTLTRFTPSINLYTFLMLPLSIVPSLIITLEDNIYLGITLILLVMIGFIDLRFKLIPNRFILLLSIPIIMYLLTDPYMSWIEIGLRVGLSFVIFILLIVIAIISNGGIGGADIKILPIVMLVLSMDEVITLMVIISVLTMVTYVIMLLLKRNENGVPLIPYVAVAFALTMLYGEQLYYLYEERLHWFIHTYM